MALRMLEYTTAIIGQFGRFPHQVVLYVGAAPLRMPAGLPDPAGLLLQNVDIREIRQRPLLESSQVEDNVIAILARSGNERKRSGKFCGTSRLWALEAGGRAGGVGLAGGAQKAGADNQTGGGTNADFKRHYGP